MVQRVKQASVSVGGVTRAEIGAGVLIYLGVGPQDDAQVARHLAVRLCALRIFPDAQGRFQHSLVESGGEALLVSQFTLFADSRRGHRPSFTRAAAPGVARHLCAVVAQEFRRQGLARTLEGEFGAHMLVASVNDGPVTVVATVGEGAWEADCG